MSSNYKYMHIQKSQHLQTLALISNTTTYDLLIQTHQMGEKVIHVLCTALIIHLSFTEMLSWDTQSFRKSFKSTAVCPVFQMSSVRASQQSDRDRPCANIGAVWTNTPPAQGGRLHRTSQWITHTDTHTTVQTYGDRQKLIRHSHIHGFLQQKTILLLWGSKSSYTNGTASQKQ